MVITRPSPMFLMAATLALVILLSGRRSQSRWPSPAPRMLSGKMCTSSATSAPSFWPTVVVPMYLPLPMSAMLALATPTTTTLSGTLTFIDSPLRALTVSRLPAICSSVPRMRVGAWARTAVETAVTTRAAIERIMEAPVRICPLTYGEHEYSAKQIGADPIFLNASAPGGGLPDLFLVGPLEQP